MSNSRVSTWSGIRNKLENDYLCPALRGHIQYFATSYSKSADHEGRAAIRMDGVEVLRSNYYTYFENVWTKFHHLAAFKAINKMTVSVHILNNNSSQFRAVENIHHLVNARLHRLFQIIARQ